MPDRSDLQVEDARRLLRAILSRRDFVQAGLVASVGALGLQACSSGGPAATSGTPPPQGTIPVGSSPVTGTVVLPAGSTLSLSTLSLNAMGQSVPLISATAFAVGVSPNTPTLAMVTDASGNGIMAGFLDPTLAGSQSITPRSTGVAQAWFALGGPFLPGNLKSQVLALLNADPVMDALGSVVAQRIAATPLAIVNGDAQIAAALTAAVNTLTAGASESGPHSARLMDDPPTLVITPAFDQGGVSVLSDNTIIGVDLANSYRRPVKVYVYETQTTTGGVATDISPAKLVAGPIDIGEPFALTSAAASARALLGLSAPFKAFTINPIPLALDGASDQTTFEVVIIGPSATGVAPAFFSAPRYATAVTVWNAAIEVLFAQTYYCDFMYGALLELSGFGSIVPNSPNLVAAGVNTRAFASFPFSGSGRTLLPTPIAKWVPDLDKSINDCLASQDLCNQFIAVAPTIMANVEALALKQVNKVDWRASLQTATNFFSKLGTAFSNYHPGATFQKAFDNLSLADAGSLWSVVVAKQKVNIAPVSPSVQAGQQVTLTAVLAPDLTSTYEFDWTQSSANSTLSAVGESNTGTAINTGKTAVNLIVPAGETGPIAVNVVVYDVANGKHTLVARADASVDVLLGATISPPLPILSRGDNQTFTVAVAAQLQPGAQYLWTLAGSAGSIGAVNFVTTTVPTLVYHANQKGTDTLTVQVLDASNRLLAKVSATINVDPDPFIQFIVAGTWGVDAAPANGSYAFTDFEGGRVSPAAPGVDAIIFTYDNTVESNGVILPIVVPTGSALHVGQTFTKFVTGPPIIGAGQFQLTVMVKLNDPDNSLQVAPGNSGTLTITAVSTLSDGSVVVSYSFFVGNSTGGIINGSGVGKFR